MAEGLALDEGSSDALADVLADALSEAPEVIVEVGAALAGDAAGMSHSLSKIAPPVGQFWPEKPGNGGMMSPQPGVG